MTTNRANFIVPEGFPFIGGAFGAAVIGGVIHPLFLVPLVPFFLFVVYFFRNPKRVVPQGENILVSTADGLVIFAGEAYENHFLGGGGLKDKVNKVSIFMSPLDVHVNRIPLTGFVKKIQYTRGKFFGAFKDKASLDNEQNAVVMENETGEEILFVQIAGFLARRIVCYLQPGTRWFTGDIFGLIRFGSRMDIYFPKRYRLMVKKGDRVKAGESIIASC